MIFVTMLPKRVSVLASVGKIVLINIFNRSVILVGDIICGVREVE